MSPSPDLKISPVFQHKKSYCHLQLHKHFQASAIESSGSNKVIQKSDKSLIPHIYDLLTKCQNRCLGFICDQFTTPQ